MKTKLAVLSILGGFAFASHGQAFLTDIRTRNDDNTALGTRLFGAGFGAADDVLAPAANASAGTAGSSIWIVSDTNGDGVPFAAVGGDRGSLFDVPIGPNGTGFLGPDDLLVRVDQVDGTLAGTQNGRYSRGGIQFPEDARQSGNPAATDPIYFILFSQPDINGPADLSAGLGMDWVNLGSGLIPPVGNPVFNLQQNLYADRGTVVPEPSTYAVGAAAALLGFGLWRRRSATKPKA